MKTCNHCGQRFNDTDYAKFDRHLEYVHGISFFFDKQDILNVIKESLEKSNLGDSSKTNEDSEK